MAAFLACAFSISAAAQGVISFQPTGGETVYLNSFSSPEGILDTHLSGLVYMNGAALSPVLLFEGHPNYSFTVSPSTVSLPGVAIGQNATLEIRVWETAFGSYEAAQAGLGFTAYSDPLPVTISASDIVLSPEYRTVPEPSFALFELLGAAALICSRVRK